MRAAARWKTERAGQQPLKSRLLAGLVDTDVLAAHHAFQPDLVAAHRRTAAMHLDGAAGLLAVFDRQFDDGAAGGDLCALDDSSLGALLRGIGRGSGSREQNADGKR